MMVCLGASLIMMVSAFGFANVLRHEKVMLDQRQLQFATIYTVNMAEIMSSLLFNSHVAGVQNKMNSTKNETSVHIVFNKMDEAEFAGIIRELKSHAAVKEISWGDNNQNESSRK
ncbi:hypothetical protein [Agriterribacter sp.]|uniref:hypothetical protein n=1 Tax=Agriterribacter sp. TaxID=2821509 RepID=UPI002BA7857D|nr:hypothetical protein [Agriterribacter sp.]HRO45706.1 hypothetical protein [Agriterribacter sp.]HRQ15816.1 hypothetical protein [Agriterribacter sp.]